ncbi:MAG: hypothetical protein WCC22_20790, partial [Terriglobales bacterium]
LLKNSLQGVSTTEFARKLLNVRPPKALKFNEITASVPFSTATPDYNSCAPWVAVACIIWYRNTSQVSEVLFAS